MAATPWHWDDTIVALATPPGIGALGVIRMSGKKAIEIANQLFPAKDLSRQPSHTLHIGFLKSGDRIIDEVVLSLYNGPRSYTGEDVVEISCHGSPFIHQQVIEVCIERGARLAKPGEFTQRAFLAGKLDLTQAEAVADLIASNTNAAHNTALQNIRGGFSQVLKQLREQLIQFSALIELELDFSEEDVAFADRSGLKQLVRQIMKQTETLLHSFKLGNVIKNGVSVAIIGKPNAGKSTLLNTLLNEDRAIVSTIPGTTRDTIEEVVNIEGILFRLIDTAGIRDHSTDVIEAAGIQKSRQKMKDANLVLYLFDVNETSPDALQDALQELEIQNSKYVVVGNKVDVQDEKAAQVRFSAFNQALFISARNGYNMDLLKSAMVQSVLQDMEQSENVVITNVRHYQTLTAVNTALQEVLDGLNNGLSGDLLALDIRRSLHYLGEITGEITNEDQLDFIFSKFCIGK